MRLVIVLVLSHLPALAGAHHSDSIYLEEIQEWSGDIVELQWRNPHVIFTLRSFDEDGRQIMRTMEANSIYRLESEGVTPETLQPGTFVTIAGRESSRSPLSVMAKNVLLEDGQEFILFGLSRYWSEGRTPRPQGKSVSDGQGLFRVWSPAGWLGQVNYLPYSEAALASREGWDFFDYYATRCEAPGMPEAMITPLPFELIDNGETIRIRGQEYDTERTVHMGGNITASDQLPSPLGYSVGRWDGDSLVVDTSQINWPYFDASGTLQSEKVAMSERFSLDFEEKSMRYLLEISDPQTFTEFAYRERSFLDLGEEIMPFNCQTHVE